jgi:hypothetical protein
MGLTLYRYTLKVTQLPPSRKPAVGWKSSRNMLNRLLVMMEKDEAKPAQHTNIDIKAVEDTFKGS